MSDPATLPTVPAGLIWDGVTEYQEVPESGTLWLCRMYSDGTRRFSETLGVPLRNVYEKMLLRRDRDGWESIGVAIEGPGAYLYGNGFLNYDGTMADLDNPPNQHYQLQNYRAHAARFAHQLDAAKGLDSVSSADEWKWETTRNTLSVLIGTAAKRYAEWEAVDPEELIVGGTYDGTLLWKRNEQFYVDTDAKLCGLCGIVTYPRQFIRHADLRTFQRHWRQGFIWSADRSTTPWAPELIDVLAAPYEDAYEALDGYYRSMIAHYEEVVGAQDLA